MSLVHRNHTENMDVTKKMAKECNHCFGSDIVSEYQIFLEYFAWLITCKFKISLRWVALLFCRWVSWLLGEIM
jgi:hypothetical protein